MNDQCTLLRHVNPTVCSKLTVYHPGDGRGNFLCRRDVRTGHYLLYRALNCCAGMPYSLLTLSISMNPLKPRVTLHMCDSCPFLREVYRHDHIDKILAKPDHAWTVRRLYRKCYLLGMCYPKQFKDKHWIEADLQRLRFIYDR